MSAGHVGTKPGEDSQTKGKSPSRAVKETIMKKYMAVFIFAMALAAPSFAAEHVITRSVKVVAKDTYKVVKYPAEKAGKGTEAAVKFVF
jgi:hypothetical protein